MPLSKEFGKLTNDQFARLVKTLPELRTQSCELTKIYQANPKRLNELLGDGPVSWGELYERPFLEQMAILTVLLRLHVPLNEAAKSSDPQEQILRWLDKDGPLDAWYESVKGSMEWKYLIWLCVVLQRNILSIMLYHQSLGGLVEAVRNGDDMAFFKAVRIDKTVLLAPTCADRLSRAELINDKTFLGHLRSAMKGPTQKHMVAIQDLRYSIVALRECGFDRFNDKDLEQLFIRTKLYPNSAGALKALRKHLNLARKIQPPQTLI